MKVGDKYIIEIEEVIRRNGAPQIARVKGFNALVFDKYGLEKLEPYDGEKLYRKGYEEGHRTGMIDGVMNIKVDEVSYQRGYKDGQKDRDMDIPPSIDDAYNRGYKDAEKKHNSDLDYKAGLEDGRMEAWELVKRIESVPDKGGLTNAQIEEVFGRYWTSYSLYNEFSADEALDLYRQWEDRQKHDAEIKVGDEVVIDDKGRKAVVSRVLDNGLYNIVFFNGDTNCVDRCFIAKTGRHFDAIAEVLAELGGEE